MKPLDTLSDDEFARLVERAVALPDVPPALSQAAVDLWAAAHPVATATVKDVAQAAWRLVRATLSFDSWASPQAAWGVRAATPSDTRHLLFTAQGRDIDLRISPTVDHFSVSGQILGPDAAGSIELVTDAEGAGGASHAHAVPLDRLGEFRLDGVRGGTYRLTLCTGQDKIVLPPITIGLRPR